MSAATEPEAMVEGAAHAEEGFDAGATIMHHILDSNEVEIPFGGGAAIPLPHLELFGFDVSITRSVVMMWIASVIVLVVMLLAARRAKDPVPRGLRAALEVLILFIRDDIARKAIDKKPDRYLGYLLTTFFFILSCNLLGLVPAMSTATGSISVTAALAVMAFVMIQGAGIREYGLVGHVKNLVPHGLPAPVVALIVPVEIIGMFAKPFALCIRLFANMTAGHVVIVSFISLIFILKSAWVATISVPFVLFIDLLELLIAFIQAYIFTMLTALFIGMSAHPAH
jgi:F-type H+-transporting ATPase subunit a